MNTTANLGKAPVRTLVLQLAIPSMTAQFVNVLYSIIDRMYIGHISQNGALALAGAGVCGPIVTFLTSFGTLVGIGGSITMGIRMGEKIIKKQNRYWRILFWCSVFFCSADYQLSSSKR